MAHIVVDRLLSEHLFGMALRSHAHVLLTEGFDVSVNIGIFLHRELCQNMLLEGLHSLESTTTNQLLRKWDLVKLHLMDLRGGGPEQRNGCNGSGELHGRLRSGNE